MSSSVTIQKKIYKRYNVSYSLSVIINSIHVIAVYYQTKTAYAGILNLCSWIKQLVQSVLYRTILIDNECFVVKTCFFVNTTIRMYYHNVYVVVYDKTTNY